MEKLTGRWRELRWALGEWDLWCVWHGSENWNLRAKYCLNYWRQHVVVDKRNNIRTYLGDAANGMSTGSVWHIILVEGTTTPARTMLSVRDTAIVAQKVSLNWTVQLLSATGPNEHCAISVWPSGRHPTESLRCYQFDDDIDPLSKTHAHCACASCDILIVPVMYKLRNTLSHCHAQNACH